MQLRIALKVIGALLAIFILVRVFGVNPVELWNKSGSAADAAAADIREIASGKRYETLGKEISRKAETVPAPSDKPLSEDEQMQRDLAAERQRFLKARQDSLNETREKVLKGEFEDHKRKREQSSRGTGEK